MKILAWNGRGLGNPRAKRSLRLYLRQHSPKVVFVCESKLSMGEATSLKNQLKVDNMVCVPCEGRRGGLIMFWSNDIKMELGTFSKYHIDMKVGEGAHSNWRVTGFYGDSQISRRETSWSILKSLKGDGSTPWLVLGDFNEVLEDADQYSRTPRPIQQIIQFRETLGFCNLFDLGYRGSRFTWSNRREGEDHVQTRIDRAVASPSCSSMFPNHNVTHLPFGSSDHCPILVDTQSSNDMNVRGNRHVKPFRFEEMWLNHEECSSIINSGWKNSTHIQNLPERLSKVSKDLVDWNHRVFGHVGRQIKKLQADLMSAWNTSNNSPDMSQIRDLENQLDTLLDREEVMWKQRSRVQWLKNGDRNTKFFHSCPSARKRKNTITRLQDDAGNVVSYKEGISVLTKDFFSSMFTASPYHDPQPITSTIQPKVTQEMNDMLLASISEEEVKSAMFQMGPSKTPGPDGFPASFY